MKIKICGIKTKEEISVINELMPDFIGFVFAKSKRQIGINEALELKKLLNPKIKTVGVFIEPDFDMILSIKSLGITDFSQLHFDSKEEFIQKLKENNVKTIKVIKQTKKSYDIKTNADFLLFDTYSKEMEGGTNKTFDWNIEIKSNVPYFVAGGLNAQNIRLMAQKLNPYGADVSSGAEENGIKTKEKVLGIMNAIKEINI